MIPFGENTSVFSTGFYRVFLPRGFVQQKDGRRTCPTIGIFAKRTCLIIGWQITRPTIGWYSKDQISGGGLQSPHY